MKDLITILLKNNRGVKLFSIDQIIEANNEFIRQQIRFVKPKRNELSIKKEFLVTNPNSKFFNLIVISSGISNKDGICLIKFNGKKDYEHIKFLELC